LAERVAVDGLQTVAVEHALRRPQSTHRRSDVLEQKVGIARLGNERIGACPDHC
jgi:hypothetical protein